MDIARRSDFRSKNQDCQHAFPAITAVLLQPLDLYLDRCHPLDLTATGGYIGSSTTVPLLRGFGKDETRFRTRFVRAATCDGVSSNRAVVSRPFSRGPSLRFDPRAAGLVAFSSRIRRFHAPASLVGNPRHACHARSSHRCFGHGHCRRHRARVDRADSTFVRQAAAFPEHCCTCARKRRIRRPHPRFIPNFCLRGTNWLRGRSRVEKGGKGGFPSGVDRPNPTSPRGSMEGAERVDVHYQCLMRNHPHDERSALRKAEPIRPSRFHEDDLVDERRRRLCTWLSTWTDGELCNEEEAIPRITMWCY